MKTREDVEFLKSNWISDPCWDLEVTEGFEEYSNELLKFRKMMEGRWQKDYNEMIQSIAQKYRCSNELAEYIYGLEIRLEKIENKE
jgi:polyhydroxyalkanoate synthesis regulator phasin